MQQDIAQKTMNISHESPSEGETREKVITVLLAEDKADVRRNLRLLFESEPDFSVICEVNNGFDALDKVGVLSPDILIMGLNASNIVEIIRRLNERCPRTAIVIPHRNDNERIEKEIAGSGLKVYVFKKISPSKFIETIRELNKNRNRSVLSFSGPRPVIPAWQSEKVTVDPYEILTKREREVLNLVITGLTNAMIASRLSISSRTVEIHRANMLRKLGLLNQHQQLTKYAIERRIIPSDNQER
jgi:DNA-binding NarL/FixJ family response regulator